MATVIDQTTRSGDGCCEVSRGQAAERGPGPPEQQRIEFSLSGQLDAEDAAKLTECLGQVPGVGATMTNPISRRLLVEFDPSETSVEELVGLVQGWDPDVDRALARWHLGLPGLDCARCARRAEQGVEAVPGVEVATWNSSARSLTIECTPERVVVAAVRAVLATRREHEFACR
jgi:cation transport ATPase